MFVIGHEMVMGLNWLEVILRWVVIGERKKNGKREIFENYGMHQVKNGIPLKLALVLNPIFLNLLKSF